MSLTYTQIINIIDDEVKSNLSSYPLATKTRDINIALDDIVDLAIRTCGIGQFDDTSHPKYPTITTDLLSGQRDVTYTQDAQGNLVLDIYKVMVKTPAGVYKEIPQVDMQTGNYPNFYNGLNTTGIPTSYDRTGNGIIFDIIPNYTQTDGVKMFINREASYFTIADTTKKAGIDGRLHEYLIISPAYKFACRNSLGNKNDLYTRKLLLENKIKEVYANKDRGIRRQIKTLNQNNH